MKLILKVRSKLNIVVYIIHNLQSNNSKLNLIEMNSMFIIKDGLLLKRSLLKLIKFLILKFALLGLYYNTINSKYKYKILSIYTINLKNFSK